MYVRTPAYFVPFVNVYSICNYLNRFVRLAIIILRRRRRSRWFDWWLSRLKDHVSDDFLTCISMSSTHIRIAYLPILCSQHPHAITGDGISLSCNTSSITATMVATSGRSEVCDFRFRKQKWRLDLTYNKIELGYPWCVVRRNWMSTLFSFRTVDAWWLWTLNLKDILWMKAGKCVCQVSKKRKGLPG